MILNCAIIDEDPEALQLLEPVSYTHLILIDGSTFSLRLSAHHFAFKLTSVTGDARA